MHRSLQGIFEFTGETPALSHQYEQADLELIASFFSDDFYPRHWCEPAQKLFKISIFAFSTVIHAWMSELPVHREILSYGRRVLTIGEKAASDHGYEDTRVVQAAAYKVLREYHRMMGFLRFTPDTGGVFTARCSPDHLVLPALGDYFTARFGDTAAWAVIDEKRNLCLSRKPGNHFNITFIEQPLSPNENAKTGNDEWEKLWQNYHKTINNESRNNPDLQRQCMPKRYWKYLSEVTNQT